MKRFLPQLIIGLVIVLITVLHFLTPLDQIVRHEVYPRLYYIPIIAAALLYGLRGGLAASLFATVIYSPHVFRSPRSSKIELHCNPSLSKKICRRM